MTLERLAGDAVVEIRTSTGPDVWTAVTCQVVSASAVSGSGKPAGILTQAEPGGLELELYDPDRLLDPMNGSSPYAGLIRPGLPIRLSHDDGTRTLIKSAVIDSVEHELGESTGRIRANDWISWASNYSYPNPPAGSSSMASADTLKKLADLLLTFVNARTTAAGVPAVPWTVDASMPTVPVQIIGYGSGATFFGPTIWGHLAGAAEAYLYSLWMDTNLVIRATDAMAPHGPVLEIGLAGPVPLGFIGRVSAEGIINFLSFVWAAAGPTGGGLTYSRYRETSMLRHGIHTYSSPRALPQSGRFGSTNTTAPDNYATAVLDDRAEPRLEAVPLRIWPSSGAELRSLLGVTPMQQVHLEFDQPPFEAYARAVGAVVSVDPDGWAVELVTYLVPADVPLVAVERSRRFDAELVPA